MKSLVEPRFRIDVDKIHELVTTCNTEEIAKKCEGRIDSILVGRKICSGDLFAMTEQSRKSRDRRNSGRNEQLQNRKNFFCLSDIPR